jgi:serine/threonine protein phosphatase PrpC
MLVLASDGVHRFVDASDLRRVLHADAPLARRCLRLVEEARANGSDDDATVLVVQRAQPRRRRLVRYALTAIAVLLALAVIAL